MIARAINSSICFFLLGCQPEFNKNSLDNPKSVRIVFLEMEALPLNSQEFASKNKNDLDKLMPLVTPHRKIKGNPKNYRLVATIEIETWNGEAVKLLMYDNGKNPAILSIAGRQELYLGANSDGSGYSDLIRQVYEIEGGK